MHRKASLRLELSPLRSQVSPAGGESHVDAKAMQRPSSAPGLAVGAASSGVHPRQVSSRIRSFERVAVQDLTHVEGVGCCHRLQAEGDSSWYLGILTYSSDSGHISAGRPCTILPRRRPILPPTGSSALHMTGNCACRPAVTVRATAICASIGAAAMAGHAIPIRRNSGVRQQCRRSLQYRRHGIVHAWVISYPPWNDGT